MLFFFFGFVCVCLGFYSFVLFVCLLFLCLLVGLFLGVCFFLCVFNHTFLWATLLPSI